jgi:hypothetical protein
MAEKERGRTRALVVLGGATLALWLLLAGRRGGQGGSGAGDRTLAGLGAPSLPAPEEVRVWLRSGDRIELDGVSSDLATTIARARVVGRASLHATGDARVGWIKTVINALRAAQVSVWADADLLSEADYMQAFAEATSLRPTREPLRNAAPRSRVKLPRYDARKGNWTGGDSRTLYAFTDPATGRVWVVPGGYAMLYGPQATVRIATRDEAEERWQRPLHAGWKVAST